MSLHSAGHVVQSVKLFAGSSITDNCRRDLVFVDFVGLCGGKTFKKNGNRRRVGGGVNSWNYLRGPTKRWAPSIKSVLDRERVKLGSEKQSSDPKPKVANLEDIISERGACGVGFITNLDNKASHGIVRDALAALGCMEHRGGCGADNDSGDGSGVMTSIPWELFDHWANEQGIGAVDRLHTGVGMIFLPRDDGLMKQAQTAILNIFNQEGLEVLGWRPVPVNESIVGQYAKETMPNILQVFVKIAKEENVDDIERELFICRKVIERAATSATWGDELYFCSLSNQTIVYKGML